MSRRIIHKVGSLCLFLLVVFLHNGVVAANSGSTSTVQPSKYATDVDATWMKIHHHTAKIRELRGGSSRRTKAPSASQNVVGPKLQRIRNIRAAALASATLIVLYTQRSSWLPLFDKDKIQQTTLDLLKRLDPEGDNQAGQTLKPMVLYFSGMLAWEFLGLSTIPVETAAGMAFGWKAAGYSFAGKLSGALTAFLIGRYVFASQIQDRLEQNELFQLINSAPSADRARRSPHTAKAHPPLLTAFLMKFSVFPEFVKNFGSSLLAPVKLWMFLLATTIHGGMFTLLWTWLGVDTVAQLESVPNHSAEPVGGQPNRSLQAALTLAAFVGFVLTPLVMTWWVRDLRRIASKQKRRMKR